MDTSAANSHKGFTRSRSFEDLRVWVEGVPGEPEGREGGEWLPAFVQGPGVARSRIETNGHAAVGFKIT